MSSSCWGAVALGVFLCAAGCGDSGFKASGDVDGYGGGNSQDGGGEAAYGGSTGDGGSGLPPPPPGPPPVVQPDTCDGIDQTKPLVLYVSSDDSNSMASPVHARESLKQGSAAVGAIRPYEFFNYYRIDYPAPPPGELSLFAEAAREPEAGAYALQLALRSFDAEPVRRPMTITFVLDTSGSMEGEGIARERAAILALASKLQEGDILNMVTWAEDQNVIFASHPASGPNDPVVVDAAYALQSNGGTDLHNGLVKGYELAEQSYDPERLNRLVLISDGGANVGVTDAELIGQKAGLDDDEGIYLVGIGAGPASSYADPLMDIVTDAGRGAYVYLDEPEEAQRILADRFDEVMEVAARGVSVQLTLPWYFQMKKF